MKNHRISIMHRYADDDFLYNLPNLQTRRNINPRHKHKGASWWLKNEKLTVYEKKSQAHNDRFADFRSCRKMSHFCRLQDAAKMWFWRKKKVNRKEIDHKYVGQAERGKRGQNLSQKQLIFHLQLRQICFINEKTWQINKLNRRTVLFEPFHLPST